MPVNGTVNNGLDLSERVAVVTGAGSGIGAGIARSMSAAGANVVLVDLNGAGLADTAKWIESAGGAAHVIEIDISVDEAPQTIVGTTIERFGSLDILVNAAGIADFEPFEDATMESFDRQMRVMARAPFALTQAATPHLAQGGKVIFFSSIAAFVGFRGTAAYAMAKGAISALVLSLGLELASQGINVNAVAPGTTVTPINDDLFAEAGRQDSIIAATPAGRLATVEDQVGPALFLASSAAAHMYGQTLIVDGGYTTQ